MGYSAGMLKALNRVRFFALFVCVMSAHGCGSTSDTPEFSGALQTAAFSGTYSQPVTLDYWQYVPDEADADEQLPLLLFLHGAGERGDDLNKVLAWGPPKRIANPGATGIWADFPAIVIAPQCPDGRWWDINTLIALLDHAERTLPVDQDRIFVTGLSMGGYATWALADRQPDRFAAIVPICGGYPHHPYVASTTLASMPIWAFHGDADDIVPLRATTEPIEAIRQAGGKPKLTVYPGVGHVSWVPAYDTPELWEWLFEQRRRPAQ